MLIKAEIAKIEKFIREYVQDDETVVVPVSGGLDSDVTARLCCRVLGKERVRLFIVLQSEMEEKFHRQAAALAAQLGVHLAEIHLENINRILIGALEESEENGLFRLDTLLDPAKAKCSLRSAVLSCYQDKGFLIAGTTNKTEKMLGFFLTFGDNLANFKPLAHLYKTEVREIAKAVGTAPDVMEQEASAGFWEGQTDAEDLAYWIINRGPILAPRDFTDEEIARAQTMAPDLTPEKVDAVLLLYEDGKTEEEAAAEAAVSREIAEGIYSIVKKARKYKSRTIMAEPEGR